MARRPAEIVIPEPVLITGRQQLMDFLARGARPREEWGVGLETEKLVVDRETGEAVGYPRVRQLLERMLKAGNWQGIYDQDHLIGLRGKRSSVTLEPGGQIELSGRFCCDIRCSWRDLRRYRNDIVQIGRELGLLFLGLGTQPFTPLEQIDWLPKARYRIMGRYMLKTGDMGQRMMKQTAGTQVNLDFSDAVDCARKLRLTQRLSAVSYALFANSPFLDGGVSGWLSTRGEIWARTDADRCGLIMPLLEAEGGLSEYVDYALDVPMYFIERDGQFVDLTESPFTFRQFLDGGWRGWSATLADWNLHLSTLFTEVRLRPQLEVRSADSLPPRFTAAVAALYKGLLYSEEGLAGTEGLLLPMTADEFMTFYRASWREGLRTLFPGGTMAELAAELVRIARVSLRQQYLDGYSSDDEGYFLDPLDTIVTSGITLAEGLLQNWPTGRREQLQVLEQHCSYDQDHAF